MISQIAEDLAKIECGDEKRSRDEIEKQIERAVLHLQLPTAWPLQLDNSGERLDRPLAFILVRHGATDWSVTGQHTGRTDLPLSTNGCCEAIIVRSILKGNLIVISLLKMKIS